MKILNSQYVSCRTVARLCSSWSIRAKVLGILYMTDTLGFSHRSLISFFPYIEHSISMPQQISTFPFVCYFPLRNLFGFFVWKSRYIPNLVILRWIRLPNSSTSRMYLQTKNKSALVLLYNLYVFFLYLILFVYYSMLILIFNSNVELQFYYYYWYFVVYYICLGLKLKL